MRVLSLLMLALLGTTCSAPSGPSGHSTLSNISGIWSGTFEVIECTANVPDRRSCAHHRTGEVVLVATQTAGTVTGNLTLRGFHYPVSGTYENGALSLAGSVKRVIDDEFLEDVLQGWRTESSGFRQMTGSTTALSRATVHGVCCTTFTRVYRLTDLHRTAGSAR
jgi:hypothetical protein